jgi:O-succinylbenzoic acid--CoA ligase
MLIQPPIVYWHELSNRDFLICENNYQLQEIACKLYLEAQAKFALGRTPKIILAEREPVVFIAGFMAACAASCQVFLCNPHWGKKEWQQVLDLVQPDLIWGDGEQINISTHSPPCAAAIDHLSSHPLIMIPTGGSSGKIKFAIHTWETLMASVQGFTEYFKITPVNSFCVLPLYHVSGLMQFMRSFTTGGKLAILPFKTLGSGQLDYIQPGNFFISLVPTQLQRLLENAELTKWLSQFKTVLLGGAPAWDELLAKARFQCISLAPTYGMTETASQIATLKPEDFFNGKINSGQILPHAQVKIRNQQGEILNANQIGNITIQGPSLALGYYPHIWEKVDYLQVDDLGFLDSQGYLNIVGRSSDKIITGGENIYPREIEAAIRSTEMVIDVCIIGVPDKYWGEAVTAIYIPKDPRVCSLKLQAELQKKLSKFKIPKHWISVPTLPRNSQGKINRQYLEKITREYLQDIP